MVHATVAGTVVRGHRVASGTCGDPRFPGGTIAAQLPFFQNRVPDFEAYLGGAAYPGTINFQVDGGSVQLGSPEIRVEAVRWTAHFAAENFFLSRCLLAVDGSPPVPAFLYVPDPATKPDHFQPASILELLARPIPHLGYGAHAVLGYDPQALAIIPSAEAPRPRPA